MQLVFSKDKKVYETGYFQIDQNLANYFMLEDSFNMIGCGFRLGRLLAQNVVFLSTIKYVNVTSFG
jgi:hypothetical protein